ncbi:MAG: hypothetical protein ABIS20_08895 [Thermoanaerobaculia bacterium]
MTEITPGPMPFRFLLDEAVWQARRHFRAIYPAIAIPVTLLATAVAVAQAVWFGKLKQDLGSLGTPFLNPGYLGLILVYSALLMVAYNTLQVAAFDAVAGRPVDLRRAWRFTLRGRVLGTLVLWYVATLASVFCCCLPALAVAPLLVLVPAVMADEGRFGFQALSRSARLTGYFPPGRWWESPLVKALLLLMVSILLIYLAGLLVSLPFQVPLYIGMFRRAAAGEDITQGFSSLVWLQVPAQFLSSLASTAVYLYFSCGIALLFHDTRGRREGSDLRAEIEAVFPSLLPPGEPGP